MPYIKSAFNIIAAVSGLVAGFLWWKSTKVVVVVPEGDQEEGFEDYQALFVYGKNDVLATALEQNKWSRYAAIAASVSVFMQSFQYGSASFSRFFALGRAMEQFCFYLKGYFNGGCRSVHDLPHGGRGFSPQAENHDVGVQEPSHVFKVHQGR